MPAWHRRYRRSLHIVVDATVLMGAFALAYLLRFEFRLDRALLWRLAPQLPFVVLIQLSALTVAGVHRRVWRYTSLRDMPFFLWAAVGATSLILLVRLSRPEVIRPLWVPVSIILMDAIFAFGGVVAVRALRRSIDEHWTNRRRGAPEGPEVPVLLVGAGRAGVLAVREMRGRDEVRINPVAFVDDSPLKQNCVIGGVKVVGTTEDIPALTRELGVDHVILTIADLPGGQKRRIARICERVPVRLREIPGILEILQGKVGFSGTQAVAPETLLGRQPVRMNEAHLDSFLKGKRVLVTGAGGSIGSELCRQIARRDPATLVLVERAENALFEIGRELEASRTSLPLPKVLADCTDSSEMGRVFELYRPQVVLHAAAHKHVTMMELNPAAAVRNNVLGTVAVGKVAGEVGAEHFVLISTDKAVRPSSVMGATKRVAELVIQRLNGTYDTTFAAVRFGNVLGSAGSVIPIFHQQIEAGGPVTLTDPRMERYFMSTAEAAQLVLIAGKTAEGGEVLILDMGESIRILDLAEKMIRLHGYEPYNDIDIEITGRRRGEKLTEELSADGFRATTHPKINVVTVESNLHDLLPAVITRLRGLARNGDGDSIREYLNKVLPDASLEIGPIEDASATMD